MLQVPLTCLDASGLEVLDTYFMDHSYVGGHVYSALDLRLLEEIGVVKMELPSLKRWNKHIDFKVKDKTEEKIDFESVTMEHVMGEINKNIKKKASENVSPFFCESFSLVASSISEFQSCWL